MGDPRIEDRDNPLVRRLNRVAEMNAELGTALGGGARPPRPSNGPVMGGTSTVLAPPAVPLSAEEALGEALPAADEAELERRWALDPSNPANKMAPNRAIAPAGDAAPENVAAPGRPREAFLQFVPTPEPKASDIDYVSLINVLPISDEQKQQVRGWVFEGMVKIVTAETNRALDKMKIALGLAPPPAKEEAKSAIQEQGGSASIRTSVQPKPRRTRKEKTVQEKPEGTQDASGVQEIVGQDTKGKRSKSKTSTRSRRNRKGLEIQGSTRA